MCVRYIDFASVFASVRLDFELFRQCGIFFGGGGILSGTLYQNRSPQAGKREN
jgi:hypothetical protein